MYSDNRDVKAPGDACASPDTVAGERAARMSRRELLAAPAMVGAVSALATVQTGRAAADPLPGQTAMPKAILGRTGMKVSRLAFGGSWHVDGEVVSLGMEQGINYIDTAESYNGGQSETAFGSILRDAGAIGHNANRKKLWLVSKTHDHFHLEGRLARSLERMQQDYVDCFYMHQVADPTLA